MQNSFYFHDIFCKILIWYLRFNIFPECDAKESIWICLTTGVLNCGRYVKAHALAHYEKTGHSVCMECRELSIFWLASFYEQIHFFSFKVSNKN